MFRISLRKLSLFFFLFLFLLLVSVSQEKDPSYKGVVDTYQLADSFYNKATRLSIAPGREDEEEGLNQKALTLFYVVSKQLPPAIPSFDSLRFFAVFRIGELEHYFEHYKEAVQGYNRSIEIKLKTHLADSFLFKPYLYAGIIYYNQNKYDSASLYFQNAEKIQLLYSNKLQEGERLYNIIGVLFYEKGDYKQAKNYFLKALELLPANHPYYKELYTNYEINLAQIYFKLEDYDEANTIYKNLLPLKVDLNEINHNIGTINLYLGAAAQALYYFRQVHYSTNKIIRLYNNMATAFMNLNQLDSAGIYLQKAVDSNAKLGTNTDHIAFGLILKSLGDLEMSQHHPENALKNYQQAILQFYPGFKDSSLRSNPDHFSGVFSYINLFNTLVAKAEAFHTMYEQGSSLDKAKEELKAYQSAFALIDYVERTYNSDEARLFLDRTKYLVHIKPIDISFELFKRTKDKQYLEDLYVFDQENKASVLALKFQMQEQLSEKDSSLLSKERLTRSEITRLSLRATQTNDSTLTAGINKQIRDLEITLGKLQDQLSMPAQRPGTGIPSISYLQKELLDDNSALISFHLSEDKLTTLTITRKNFTCDQQLLFDGFHDQIAAYINSLRNPPSDEEPDTAASKFYNFLFRQTALNGVNRLVIIPDDELNYLSFESLKDKEGDYLIQHYSVQYQFSTALLRKENIRFSGHQILALAPFTRDGYEDSSLHLDRLPNSREEIQNLRGKQFYDGEATKKNFLDNISKYSVIHLATHAVVNPSEAGLSFIAFSPGESRSPQDFLLYAEEIYNLPLKGTDLVILSACETGSGNLVKGEGIMSLSRAFAYAGCNNIISSLWNANDFSTAYLTDRIHLYLDKNYSVDQALREAKLDYLKDRKINPRFKHPFYWSHLVFIGNYDSRSSSSTWQCILAGIGLLVIIYLLLKNRSRRSRDLVSHRRNNSRI